ncbi:MAG: hypothetical protein MR409_09190, partial [Lachnospiraceae bacterium]|nr:hypothetical protein [Lachnospiraceae bacterium]
MEQAIEKYEKYEKLKLATPISNGGLLLYPPGIITGSAKGGISQYHFYWLPSKEGSRYFLPS